MPVTVMPTVHLNGTSRESLIADYARAYEAVQAAYEALRDLSPHGRDYDVQGSLALTRAEQEHGDRLVAIDGVRDDLRVLLQHVHDTSS